MEMYFFAGKEVIVNAVTFQGRERLSAFPKRMVFEGQEVTFEQGNLREEREDTKTFDMTDGQNRYELKFELWSQAWKLQHVVTAG